MLLLLANVFLYLLPAQETIVSDFVSLSPKPIIEVQLNGKIAYFLLDSGSEITLLHAESAEEYDFQLLNYVPGGIQKVVGLGTVSDHLYGAGKVRMNIGNLRIRSLYVATDLSNVIKTVRYNTRYKLTGIIGSDVMKKYGFLLDYQNQKLLINHSQQSERMSK